MKVLAVMRQLFLVQPIGHLQLVSPFVYRIPCSLGKAGRPPLLSVPATVL